MVSLLIGFGGLVRREFALLFRQPFDGLLPLAFFFLVNMLFAIGAGGSAARLQPAAAAIIFAALLTAALLAHDGIFRRDYENGFIEQVLAGAQPPALFALAKISAHWLFVCMPLALASPPLAVMLGMPAAGLVTLLLVLPPATLTLSLFTVFAAALSVGQKNQLLPVLLALPLLIPVLIFAVSAVELAAAAQSPLAAIYFLSALSLFALTLMPLATAALIKTLAT